MRHLLLFFIFTLSLFGEFIESYDTKVVVFNNSKVSVKENILYNFENSIKHGIYRDIPKNDTKIKNLKVYQNGAPATFKLINNQKFWRIRIGNPNYYVRGIVEYTIKFNLEGVVVRAKDNRNFIAYDLVGTGWKKPIKRAHGIIYLPKVLQGRVETKAFRGSFGSTNSVKVVNKGSYVEAYANNLKPHEGLTIYLSFDKSLMSISKKPSDDYYKSPLFYLFLSPVLALFYYIAKRFNVFHNIGSIAPKYRPPKDLTLMEAGVIKDNFVDFSEIKPAILELANLGYIKIEEEQGELYLVKLKEADKTLSQDQKLLLSEIFNNFNQVDSKELRIKESLFENIKEIIHKSMVEKGYFSKSIKDSRNSFLFGVFGVGILSIGAFFYYIFQDTGLDLFVPTAVSLVFITIGVVNLLSSIKRGDFGGIFFYIMWILFSSIFLFSIFNSKGVAISLILMLSIIAIGSFIIYKRMNTLTFKGELAKKHIMGLEEFIDRADKDKIKFLLKEDPKYLDKMLPYAVLFGLNKHWLNLYKELEAPLPTWYDGNLDGFIDLDFEPANINPESAIDSSPSIDIGDFGSFGDFSGGGFGGGGGDSW